MADARCRRLRDIDAPQDKPGLLNTQTLSADLALVSLALVPLVVVAAFLGRWIASRIPQSVFERLVLGLAAVDGVNLLL